MGLFSLVVSVENSLHRNVYHCHRLNEMKENNKDVSSDSLLTEKCKIESHNSEE